MKLARLCEHDEIKPHYPPKGLGNDRCPGGVFLPDDTLVIENAPVEELHNRIKDVEVLAFDGRDYSGASAAQVISPDELGRILDVLSVREAE